MKGYVKFIALAAVVLVLAGAVAAGVTKDASLNGCGGCSRSCAGCDGNCGDCKGNCGEGACGDCKGGGCSGGNCSGGSGNCKDKGNCSETNAACEEKTQSNVKILFQSSEYIVNGTPNGAAKHFQIKTMSADKNAFDFSVKMHAVGCSGAGQGAVFVTLLDGKNNVVFQKQYAGDASDSVELKNAGCEYTLVIAGAGGGTSYVVWYSATVWAENPSEDCGSCGGCPP